MLKHPTEERLLALGFIGMAKALEEQRRQPDIAALSFEERFALLVDREATERDNKRLVTRLRFASLRQNAVVPGDRDAPEAMRARWTEWRAAVAAPPAHSGRPPPARVRPPEPSWLALR